MFVFDDPRTHLWTRGIAFLYAFYIYKIGNDTNDNFLKLIGLSQGIFDLITFKMSVEQLKEK
jgi:hypothetical protein